MPKAWLVGLGISLLLAGCSSQPKAPTDSLSQQLPETTYKQQAGHSQNVLFHALGLIGTPYLWGGNTPETGFDCSGLIAYVYDQSAGVQLPRTTSQMHSYSSAPKVARNQWRSGDILYFATAGNGKVSHAGIYVGEGRFVHAPSSGGTVRLDRMDNSYWSKAYIGANRPLAKN
ncbi:C40 family peptidase [Thiopseudomonas alkaliphila]|uniref:C40 family peptidase n=1 Tax=Thiopseudomonas alkaliphila TaxID=1697053 RepID=A0AAW7DTC2_9GAMM|nr:C40 family peptidase [Thiopseudomonas alkaliphila]MDM1696253.1 C40 family peptidase [Thiopseudomonas alkaliphila]